jgi:hypothetical protein
LVGNLWAPLPLHPDTKIPSRKSWQHRATMPPDRLLQEVTRELSWRGEADRRGAACGSAAQHHTVGVDCDIIDRAANEVVWQIMTEVLGPPPMTRVGQLPKWLVIYAALPGLSSRRLPGLDLYCGSGQNAMFGLHHKTRRPYRWSERNPLNTRSVDVRPCVSPQQYDRFAARVIASGVLPGSPKNTTVVSKSTGASTDHVPSVMAQRLNELCDQCGGLVRPGVRQLIEEIGAAGCGRHNALVTVCGKLVQLRWNERQVIDFLLPLVNERFAAGPDDNWKDEVVAAFQHARERDATRCKTGSPAAARGATA